MGITDIMVHWWENYRQHPVLDAIGVLLVLTAFAIAAARFGGLIGPPRAMHHGGRHLIWPAPP